jgi:predicted component of type VI protein secretion system
MSNFPGAKIEFAGPGATVEALLVAPRTTFGRNEGNEVVLNDAAVSSHHGEFLLDDRGLTLVDLGSANGSFVNGQRVMQRRLRPGDLVRVGRFEGRVVFGDALHAGADGSARRRRVAVTVGAMVLVVVASALGLFARRLRQQEALREAYAEYEAAARAYAAVDPCLPGVEPATRHLAIARSLAPVEGAAPDPKEAAELRVKQARIEIQAIARIGALVVDQKTLEERIQQASAGFKDEALLAGVTATLTPLRARRLEASQALLEAWKETAKGRGVGPDLVQAVNACSAVQAETLEPMLTSLAGAAL